MSVIRVKMLCRDRVIEVEVERGCMVIDAIRKAGFKASSVIVLYNGRIIPLNSRLYSDVELAVENCMYRG